MRPRRWNEQFALFFDPTVPIAFIVGSLALAVAGSALYSVLSAWIGVDAPSQLWLLAGSLLAVIAAVLALRQAVRLWVQRQGRGQLVVPPEQRAEAHASLILPVGLSPTGAEPAIIGYHARNGVLKHCWLLVSREVEASKKLGDLRQLLLDSGAEPHIVRVASIYELAESYTAALDAIRAARATRGALPLIADMTGGTAVMSVGLALAAREQGVPLEYYGANYRVETGSVDTTSGTAPQLVAFVAGAQEAA